LFPPFVALLVDLGTPAALAVYRLANLTAGLTHYGTTTAPIISLSSTSVSGTGGVSASSSLSPT